MDVILSDTDVVQPDIVVVAEAHRDRVTERAVEGAPDLVIEILSQNRAHDTVLKRALYARYGVPEYWIVDGDAATVEVLRLRRTGYARHALFGRRDTLVSPSFDGRLRVDLARVFAPAFAPRKRARRA